MKLNIIIFSITALIIATIPMSVLFIWCGVNGFGAELVRLFELIHPSGGFSIIDNIGKDFSTVIPGIIINTIYVAVDSFIAGFTFSSLYNFLVTRTSKKESNN
jgi:hypothetical protein